MPTYDSKHWDWGRGCCARHPGQELPCRACIDGGCRDVKASYPCVLTEDSPAKRALYADPARPGGDATIEVSPVNSHLPPDYLAALMAWSPTRQRHDLTNARLASIVRERLNQYRDRLAFLRDLAMADRGNDFNRREADQYRACIDELEIVLKLAGLP